MTATVMHSGTNAAVQAAESIEIRSLSAGYHLAGTHRVVLRDVTLSVAAGEMLGLVGPNGSGKTTLIRAITKSVRLLCGQVLVCGDHVSTLSQREVARRIAVVPQDPPLPEEFTAFETVLMGRTPHLRLLQNEGAKDIDAARRAMRLTDTLDLAHRPVGQLSGGERQRVVVARALAQEAPILLLDEPTTHLDIGHQAAILDLMRSLCRTEGKAVLAVVHDLTLASQYCDRLVMLRLGGTIAACGPADDVLTSELLTEVYAVQPGRIDIFPHPQTGRPVVAPRPEGG